MKPTARRIRAAAAQPAARRFRTGIEREERPEGNHPAGTVLFREPRREPAPDLGAVGRSALGNGGGVHHAQHPAQDLAAGAQLFRGLDLPPHGFGVFRLAVEIEDQVVVFELIQ